MVIEETNIYLSIKNSNDIIDKLQELKAIEKNLSIERRYTLCNELGTINLNK